MSDGKMNFLLLGIENQSEIHYAMPIKNMIYDALNYGKQVEKTAAIHREKKDWKNSAEFLSGFSQTDKLIPVITLTIYFGGKKWEAPRTLKEMFPTDMDETILEEVNDYKLHLLIPSEIEDFSLFRTELGKAMKFIAASEEPIKMKKITKDENFQNVSEDTARLINVYADNNIIIRKKEGTNMCKGLEGYGEMMRQEGRQEGLQEGHREGMLECTIGLVQKGLLTVKDAAEHLGMAVEELQKKMQEM